MSTEPMALEKVGEDLELVTFKLGKEVFGIEIGVVKEIINVPAITPIPNTTEYFRGILNIRGETISVIDIRRRFNLPPALQDDQSRIVVLKIRKRLIGILVDSVAEVLNLTDITVQPPSSVIQAETEKFLKGMIRLGDDQDIILLIDLNMFFNQADLKTIDDMTKTEEGLPKENIQEKKEEEKKSVTFLINGELFALHIYDVKEVISLPVITHVPNAPPMAKGIMSLRGQIIPVVNIRFCFGEEERGEEDKFQKVIIVNIEGTEIGILADEVSEVLKSESDARVPPPPIISLAKSKKVSEVIKVKRGDKKKIILLLNLSGLFSKSEREALKEVAHEADGIESKEEQEQVKEDKEIENVYVVTFETGDDVFGVDIRHVNEINVPSKITNVPNAPAHIDGIINLRGLVIPVLNLRKKLSFPSKEINALSRILIIELEGIKTGVLVDSVNAVKSFNRSLFEEAPKALTSVGSEFIESVLKMDGEEKILIMLDLPILLAEDVKDIKKLVAGK